MHMMSFRNCWITPRVISSFLMLQSFSLAAHDVKRVPRLGCRRPPEAWKPLAFSAQICSRTVATSLQDRFRALSLQDRLHLAWQRPRRTVSHINVRMLADGRDRGQRGASRRDIRLFLDGAELSDGVAVDFSDAQTRYLRKVMRVGEGSEVKVFDGATGEWWCRIDSYGKKAALGTVTEQRRSMVLEPDVWVVFAAVKGDATETIIQKATELGASRFVPIITKRAVVKSIRRERASLIAMEAAEQCERLSPPPSILDPQPLDGLVASWPSGRRLILCDETASGAPLDALGALPPGSSAAVVVGPEGGWAGDELETLRSVEGMISISLGPRILRADTAVIAALSLYQSAVGDWRGAP